VTEGDVAECPLTAAEKATLKAYFEQHQLPQELAPLLAAAVVYGRGFDHPDGFSIFAPAALDAVNARIGETAGDFFRHLMKPDYSDHVESGCLEAAA